MRIDNKEAIEALKERFTDTVNQQVANYITKLRNRLQIATPKDTKHGAINWLIRKYDVRKEYGDRPKLGQKKEKRPYNQPILSNSQTGEHNVIKFDITKKTDSNIKIINNVPYVYFINEGISVIPTHIQYEWFVKNTVNTVNAELGIK